MTTMVGPTGPRSEPRRSQADNRESHIVRSSQRLSPNLGGTALGAVSIGTQETPGCLRDSRLLTLVADDSHDPSGVHRRQWLGLFDLTQIVTFLGSAALEVFNDLVEAALQQ